MALGTLGSLFISIGADVAQMKEAMTRAEYLADQASTKIDSSMRKASNAIAGLAAGYASFKTLDAFADTIQSTIKAGAELEVLSQKAGMSASSLSALKVAAAQSGTDIETVVTGAQKLAKGMLDTAAGTGKAKGAFMSLGLSVRDSTGQLKATDDMMLEVAQKLSTMENETQKVAYAQQIFGKAGANLLPMLKDMAEIGELVGKVTDDQAEAAHNYELTLRKLDATKKAMWNTISYQLLPVMQAFATTLLQTANSSDGLKASVSELAADNKIREWAETGAIWLAKLIDIGRAVVAAFKIIGEAVAAVAIDIMGAGKIIAGALLAMTNPAAGLQMMKDGWAQLGSAAGSFADDMAAIADNYVKNSFETKLRANIEATKKPLEEHAARVKTTYDIIAAAPKDATDAADKYFDSLGKQVAKGTAHLNSLIGGYEGTMEAEARFEVENGAVAKALNDTTKYTADAAEETRKNIIAKAQEVDAIKSATKGWSDYLAAVKKAREEMGAQVQTVVDKIEAMKDEIATIGMTREATLDYTIAKLESRKADLLVMEGAEDYVKALQLQIDKMTQLRNLTQQSDDLKRQQADFASFWNNIDGLTKSVFDNIVSGGGDTWTKLRDGAKKIFFDWLYTMTLRKWVFSAVFAADGSGGSGQLVNSVLGGGGGGMGSIGNAIGSYVGSAVSTYLYSQVGMGAGGIPAASGMGVQAAVDSYLINNGMASYAGYGVGGLAAAGYGVVGGVVGGIGAHALGAGDRGVTTGAISGATLAYIGAVVFGPIGAAIGAVLGAVIGKFTDPDGLANRSANYGSIKPGQQADYQSHTPFGDFGITNTKWFSDKDMGPALTAFADGITQIDTAISSFLTKDQIAKVKEKFANFNPNYSFGQEHGGFADTLRDMMKDHVLVIIDEIAPALHNVVAKFKGPVDDLAKIITSMIALDLSDIPQKWKDLIEGFKGTDDQLVAMVTQVGNAAQLFGALSIDPVKDFNDMLTQAQGGLWGSLTANKTALVNLIAAYDGSTQATQDIMTLTQQRYQMEMQFLANIHDAQVAIQQSSGSAIRSMQLSTMDNQGKYNFYDNEIASFREAMKTSLDPAEVQRLANDSVTDIQNAFALLSPDEQVAKLPEFIARINTVTADANKRLKELTDTISGEHSVSVPDSIAAKISDALDQWLVKQREIADRQQEAANTMLEAAREQAHGNVNARTGAIDYTGSQVYQSGGD